MSDLKFQAPTSVIRDKFLLKEFLESDTCKEILQFILRLNDSVKGKPNSVECEISNVRPIVVEVISDNGFRSLPQFCPF
jgi:hypothetical protein